MNDVEFNPEFISRMIPKLEWSALVKAAEEVSQTATETSRTFIVSNRGSIRLVCGAFEWCVITGALLLEMRWTKYKTVQTKFLLLILFSPQLGHRQDLPGELVPEYEKNEEFLKKVHRALVEVCSSQSFLAVLFM